MTPNPDEIEVIGEVPALSDEERTRCEIWDRVMGYHRPVSAFNAGKQSEFRDRKRFAGSIAAKRFDLAENEWLV